MEDDNHTSRSGCTACMRSQGAAAVAAQWKLTAAAMATATALGLGHAASAQLDVSIAVRETAAGGAPDVGIGNDGGSSGGIEWVNRDGQSLVLDGTWQLFTFHITTDPLTAFAGTTANSILEGDYGVLEHIRFRNAGGQTENLRIWIDDVRNTFQPAGGPPVGVNFGNFEGYADGTEVMFQEPTFSGSTSSNLVPFSTAGVDNSAAHSGNASYALSMQFVDSDPNRWVRLTTFGSDFLPNPQIRLDQESVVSFWARGIIPGPGGLAILMIAGVCGRRRLRRG